MLGHVILSFVSTSDELCDAYVHVCAPILCNNQHFIHVQPFEALQCISTCIRYRSLCEM